jgi:hypothetical protein
MRHHRTRLPSQVICDATLMAKACECEARCNAGAAVWWMCVLRGREGGREGGLCHKACVVAWER